MSDMAHPPQRVVDWIAVAVRHTEATGGVGCPECCGDIPSAAAKRGHDRHPQDCKASLERRFAALNIQTFLNQPAEAWYFAAEIERLRAEVDDQFTSDELAQIEASLEALQAERALADRLHDAGKILYDQLASLLTWQPIAAVQLHEWEEADDAWAEARQ